MWVRVGSLPLLDFCVYMVLREFQLRRKSEIRRFNRTMQAIIGSASFFQ